MIKDMLLLLQPADCAQPGRGAAGWSLTVVLLGAMMVPTANG